MEEPKIEPVPRADRRRSQRVALEIPLVLVIDGRSCLVRTVLANRTGVLVYSPKLCPPGSVVEARNPANGQSAPLRVAWSWVDGSGPGKTVRLALEKVVEGARLWDYEYDRRLRRVDLQALDRRRAPRVSLVTLVEVDGHGSRRPAETFDVSDTGVGILSDRRLEPGLVLRLIRPGLGRAADFRVVWERPEGSFPDTSPRYRVGMALVREVPGFWSSRAAFA
jgi:hypothetical protein